MRCEVGWGRFCIRNAVNYFYGACGSYYARPGNYLPKSGVKPTFRPDCFVRHGLSLRHGNAERDRAGEFNAAREIIVDAFSLYWNRFECRRIILSLTAMVI